MNPQLNKLLTNGLRLYYKILKLHHRDLPPSIRILGDQYVRQEFKHHHDKPELEYYKKFISKWEQYYIQMKTKGLNQSARNITPQEEQLLSKEQKQALRLLKEGIVKKQ